MDGEGVSAWLIGYLQRLLFFFFFFLRGGLGGEGANSPQVAGDPRVFAAGSRSRFPFRKGRRLRAASGLRVGGVPWGFLGDH